jgi:beta-lactam-binding protein with PASTA domain
MEALDMDGRNNLSIPALTTGLLGRRSAETEKYNFRVPGLFALLILTILGSCGGGGSADNVAKISVPNVVGLTETVATSELAGAGLTVGTITSMSSSTIPSGNVESQLPAAGAFLTATSPVSLTVSSGPAVVSVPSLVGMSLAAATSALTGLGLVVGTITMMNSAAVPLGNLISQDPLAGDMVAAGSAIN